MTIYSGYSKALHRAPNQKRVSNITLKEAVKGIQRDKKRLENDHISGKKKKKVCECCSVL